MFVRIIIQWFIFSLSLYKQSKELKPKERLHKQMERLYDLYVASISILEKLLDEFEFRKFRFRPNHSYWHKESRLLL